MDSTSLKSFLFCVFVSLSSCAQEWGDHLILRDHFKSNPILRMRPLVGGESFDKLFKIETTKGYFVLRVLNQKRSLEKRRLICEATKLIGEQKLGPMVIWYDPSYHFLVTEFIEGNPLTSHDLQDPKIFRQFVFLIKKSHAILDRLSSSIEPYSLKDRVLQRLKEVESFIFDPILSKDLRSFLEAEFSIKKYHFSHGDVKGSNILKTKTNLFLIDWGEIGISSIYDDLGSLSFHFQLSEDQERDLLILYFGAYPQESAFRALLFHRWLAERHDFLFKLRKKSQKKFTSLIVKDNG